MSKRFWNSLGLIAGAAAVGLGAQTTRAALTIDLRATSVSGSPGTAVLNGGKLVVPPIPVIPANVTVTMAVWAQVTGTNASLPEALKSVSGSFLSTTGGGSAPGNLSILNMPTVWQATTFSNGFAQDLDGDGDLDIGSNDNSSPDNFFRARANRAVGTWSNFDGTAPGLSTNAIANGTEYRIALLRFVQTGTETADTFINFRPWVSALGSEWLEDADEVSTIDDGGTTDDDSDDFTIGFTYENGNAFTAGSGAISSGLPIHILHPAVPEPASLGLIALAGLGLLTRRRD